MLVLCISAAFVGLVHSLLPGHWLPVVLVAKSRKWGGASATLGALTAASGHVVLSILLAVTGVEIGAAMIDLYESRVERYAALGAIAFGIVYALIAYFRHHNCHGEHTHHGPAVGESKRAPFLFLASIGFSPCVAALPVFAAAAPRGHFTLAVTLASFSAGVVTAFVGATWVALKGLIKLDLPFFEHYGDVTTGIAVSLMGVILYLFN